MQISCGQFLCEIWHKQFLVCYLFFFSFLSSGNQALVQPLLCLWVVCLVNKYHLMTNRWGLIIRQDVYHDLELLMNYVNNTSRHDGCILSCCITVLLYLQRGFLYKIVLNVHTLWLGFVMSLAIGYSDIG